MRLSIVDINLERGPSEGCRAIEASFQRLHPGIEITHQHWSDLDELTPERLVLGPNGTPFPAYPDEFQSFLSKVRHYQGPLLGICGGHQVLGLAHGASVGPVHDLPPASISYAGMPKVEGAVTIRVVEAHHPLMLKIDPLFSLSASHVDELKSLPQHFTLLATNEVSRVQVMARRGLLQVGIQCHPERPLGDVHGETLLGRWLELSSSAT